MIQLSKRLQAVVDLGTFGDTMADIGTDHAYIPIYLVQNQRVSGAIAMDIGKGPLLRASEHIEKYHLGAYIQTRLSDGAEQLTAGEVSSVVIAGMGGGLMQKILSRSEEVFHSAKEIILQPQSEIEQTRRFLTDNGYRIHAENMVWEDGKYYPMMRVSYITQKQDGENLYENAADIDYLYGAYLLKEKNPVLRSYLEKEQDTVTKIIQKLESVSQKSEVEDRLNELNEQLLRTKQALQIVGKTDEVQ